MKELLPLDEFGKFVVENLRDKGIGFAECLVRNHWKAPSLLEVQNKIASLNDDQKVAFITAVTLVVDNAMHDFLFALQEKDNIQILVNGEDVVQLSDGLHGEAYSDEGWFAKYSKYNSVY